MGEAILSGALDEGVLAAGDVVVAEVIASRRAHLEATYRVSTTAVASEAMATADVVLLSVKPQEAKSATGKLTSGAVLISIMAGVRIATLAADFGHGRIIRVMPNTPAAVRAGMSVWTATEAVDDGQRAFARALLGAIGRELYVTEEKKLDMATAVNGSGPAYLFLVIEAMVEGAVAVGLPRVQAEEIVLQTVYGSALYARESGRGAAELRAAVTSPAGTTAAGLLELERGAVRAHIIDAIGAAYRRSVELGGPG